MLQECPLWYKNIANIVIGRDILIFTEELFFITCFESMQFKVNCIFVLLTAFMEFSIIHIFSKDDQEF